MDAIPNRIREVRRAGGVKQKDLAAAVGISAGHLSHLEKSGRGLSMKMLDQIATALEVKPSELLADPPSDAEVPFAGYLRADGLVQREGQPRTQKLDFDSQNGVAVEIADATGLPEGFATGDLLIVRRDDDPALCLDRMAIVTLAGGRTVMGRIVEGRDAGSHTVVTRDGVIHGAEIAACALVTHLFRRVS